MTQPGQPLPPEIRPAVDTADPPQDVDYNPSRPLPADAAAKFGKRTDDGAAWSERLRQSPTLEIRLGSRDLSSLP
jgi:hypothetical protein